MLAILEANCDGFVATPGNSVNRAREGIRSAEIITGRLFRHAVAGFFPSAGYNGPSPGFGHKIINMSLSTMFALNLRTPILNPPTGLRTLIPRGVTLYIDPYNPRAVTWRPLHRRFHIQQLCEKVEFYGKD